MDSFNPNSLFLIPVLILLLFRFASNNSAYKEAAKSVRDAEKRRFWRYSKSERSMIESLERMLEGIELNKNFFKLWIASGLVWVSILMSLTIFPIFARVIPENYSWPDLVSSTSLFFGLKHWMVKILIALLYSLLAAVTALVFRFVFVGFFQEKRIKKLKKLCDRSDFKEFLVKLEKDEEDGIIALKVRRYLLHQEIKKLSGEYKGLIARGKKFFDQYAKEYRPRSLRRI
jgi:hypothetical protein